MSEVHEQRTPVVLSGLSEDDPHLQPAAKNPQLVERVIALNFLLGIVLVAGFGASYWVNASSHPGLRPRRWIDRHRLSRRDPGHRSRTSGRPDRAHSYFEPELHDPKGPRDLGSVGLRGVLQDVHAPRLSGRTLRTATAAPGLSVSPVDVQRHQRRDPSVRPRAEAAAPTAALH